MKSKGSKNTSSSSGSKNLIAIVSVVALGYGGYKYFIQESGSNKVNVSKIRRLKDRDEGPIKYPENSPYKSDGTSKTKKERKAKAPKISGNVAKIQKIVEQRKIIQKQLRESFKSELQIKAKLPENLYYANLDLDDGVAGIRGTGKGDIEDLTILATKKRVDEKLIADYLNNGDSGVPVAKGIKFNSRAIKEVSAPAGKGIGLIKILESNNPRIKAAYMPRSDGQGSYLFIIDADTSVYDTNEGLLDNLLENFEAQ